jgi:beta-glucosidase/6-phospho-beta-glucosidase/beta-galactosidase
LIWTEKLLPTGKGVSNIDKITHDAFYSTNGDTACDSYEKYNDDVTILKETNVSDSDK